MFPLVSPCLDTVKQGPEFNEYARTKSCLDRNKFTGISLAIHPTSPHRLRRLFCLVFQGQCCLSIGLLYGSHEGCLETLELLMMPRQKFEFTMWFLHVHTWLPYTYIGLKFWNKQTHSTQKPKNLSSSPQLLGLARLQQSSGVQINRSKNPRPKNISHRSRRWTEGNKPPESPRTCWSLC